MRISDWSSDVCSSDLRTRALGDPYYCQCRKTTRLLAERLERDVRISFQSRFGRAKWLEPATDAVLRELPVGGVRSVAVIAPGFAAACLETLEDLAICGRDGFLAAGGECPAYLPCRNSGAAGVTMLKILLSGDFAGWV